MYATKVCMIQGVGERTQCFKIPITQDCLISIKYVTVLRQIVTIQLDFYKRSSNCIKTLIN